MAKDILRMHLDQQLTLPEDLSIQELGFVYHFSASKRKQPLPETCKAMILLQLTFHISIPTISALSFGVPWYWFLYKSAWVTSMLIGFNTTLNF